MRKKEGSPRRPFRTTENCATRLTARGRQVLVVDRVRARDAMPLDRTAVRDRREAQVVALDRGVGVRAVVCDFDEASRTAGADRRDVLAGDAARAGEADRGVRRSERAL